MARVTDEQRVAFSTRLNELNSLIDMSQFSNDEDRVNLKATVDSIKAKLGTTEESTVEADLDGLVNDIVSKFELSNYNRLLSANFYAISSDDAFNFGRLSAEIAQASDSDKIVAITNFINHFNNVVDKLKTAGIIDENLNKNVDDMSRHKERKFERATDKASDAIKELDELRAELNNARTRNDKQEIALVARKIDRQLKNLNSTNRTMNRLRKKVGKIEPHQRSIKIKAIQAAAIRNKAVADSLYNSENMNELLLNLKQAYEKERNATTASELYQAKRDIKKAEKNLYGKKLTKRRATKIDAAMEKRNKIIERAQSTVIEGNHAYRKNFNKTMQKLEKVDKKIIGKRNAKDLYWGRDGLKKKSGYLIGGTELTLPSQIVELESSIKSASR